MNSSWQADDGGSVWVVREGGGSVPAIADPIRMSAGDTRFLTMDFGNLRELADLTKSIDPNAMMGVVIEPSSGLSLSALVPTDYSVAAWFSGGNAGEYTVAVTVTLTDGTVVTRKGALILE